MNKLAEQADEVTGSPDRVYYNGMPVNKSHRLFSQAPECRA